MILESTVGAIVGGLTRAVPEVLKFFTRKGDQKHELLMMDKEMEFTRLRGDISYRETEAKVSIAELDAIAVSHRAEADVAVAAGKFAATINSLVRPAITTLLFGAYSVVKTLALWMAYTTEADWQQVIISSWDADDAAMLSMILSYYFLDRTFSKRGR